MKELIEKYCQKVGWDILYPNTVERLEYFISALRVSIPVEEMSDEELTTVVVLNIARHDGQGGVYGIYSKAQQMCDLKIGEDNIQTLSNGFKLFCDTVIEEIGKDKNIEDYILIDLFFQFLFSEVINSKFIK